MFVSVELPPPFPQRNDERNDERNEEGERPEQEEEEQGVYFYDLIAFYWTQLFIFCRKMALL